MTRIRRRAFAALLGVLAAAAAGADPVSEDAAGAARIEPVLAEQRTRDAITAFVGVPVAVCVESAPGAQLCEWRAGNRDPGWAPLAAAIDTDDRINLLCELPGDGRPRAHGSCTAHPRRSNRDEWTVRKPPPSGRRRPDPGALAREREELRRIAVAMLARARTLVALSRLVGAAPDECSSPSEEAPVCLWHATSHTWGHGALGASIGAPKRKKLRLRCRLPTDGGARAPDSCSVEIGA